METQEPIYREDRQLWRAVLQAIRPFPLNNPDCKLLVGVSGGADSLALLHLLWQQLGSKRLLVAHLNHQLRPEAASDAEFVARTAASWEISCEVNSVAVADFAVQFQLSLEAAGRLARYRFFAETAKKMGAEAVVVGHHADDQAETILLHLLRGSGSGGLRGMQAVSVLPGNGETMLLRPFLTTPRTKIDAYCTRHNLQPRHDASNNDVQFLRNRIRHELLPLLQDYNPQIEKNLQQLAAITVDEYAAIQQVFKQIWPTLVLATVDGSLLLDRHKFQALAVAWQRLTLRRAVQQLRPTMTEISFRTIELARNLVLENQSGMEASLPGGLTMRVEAETIAFGNARAAFMAAAPQLQTRQPVSLPIPGEITLANGWIVTSDLADSFSLAEIKQNEDEWQAFVALPGLDELWIRPFVPEERFQPLGMGGQSQKIMDLLSNRKVPQGQRPLWPIISTAKHPVWIVGQHLDERIRVTNNAPRVVQLCCFQREGASRIRK